jgi:hypothetical protein
MKADPNCKICHGNGLVGTYFYAIDDNDLEPCTCVQEDSSK